MRRWRSIVGCVCFHSRLLMKMVPIDVYSIIRIGAVYITTIYVVPKGVGIAHTHSCAGIDCRVVMASRLKVTIGRVNTRVSARNNRASTC
jgi:hypothetical protein